MTLNRETNKFPGFSDQKGATDFEKGEALGYPADDTGYPADSVWHLCLRSGHRYSYRVFI